MLLLVSLNLERDEGVEPLIFNHATNVDFGVSGSTVRPFGAHQNKVELFSCEGNLRYWGCAQTYHR